MDAKFVRGYKIKAGADLHQADLHGADLQGADLREANLQRADLREAQNIIAMGPIGSRWDILYAVKFPKTIMFKTGCFWGDGAQLLAAANKQHGLSNPIVIQYRAAIQFSKTVFQQYKKLDNDIPF